MSGSTNREPKKVVSSPIRESIKPYQPYDRRFRVNQSPHSILRALGRLPPESSKLESMSVEPPTPKATIKPLEAPISRNIEEEFAEFDRRYQELKSRQPKLPTRNNVHLDFIHKKMRHGIRMDDTLSEISYHTDSNYSRLDYQSVVEDDLVSLGTQDMLLDEDDDRIVLDTQEILHLEKKIYQAVDMTLDDVQPVQHMQSTQPIQPVVDMTLEDESFQPVVTKRKNKGKEKEVIPLPPSRSPPFEDMVSPTPSSPPPAIITNNNDNELLISAPDNNQPLTQIPDHSDNFSDYSAGGCEPTYTDEEGSAPLEPQQFDTNMDWGDDIIEDTDDNEPINTKPSKRIIQGDSFIHKRMETRPTEKPIFESKHIRERFSNFISRDMHLRVKVQDFKKVGFLFMEQLIDDLLAYKNHQGDPDGDITEQDMILLMKRQRILNDKTTIQSLAHKYLDGESVNALCQHAEAYNTLSPPDGIDFNLVGPKNYFLDYLKKEEEDDNA